MSLPTYTHDALFNILSAYDNSLKYLPEFPNLLPNKLTTNKLYFSI